LPDPIDVLDVDLKDHRYVETSRQDKDPSF
jgi:hypothetical protein